MDPHAHSEYLAKLYGMHHPTDTPTHTHHIEMDDETDTLSDSEMCRLKTNALKEITKKLCLKSVPCDPGCSHELKSDVDQTVDRYFNMDSGKLLQYFNDTKNAVTDIIREAMEDELEKGTPVSEEDNNFIVAVVDKVKDDEDVDQVLKTVENQIRSSAEDDIKNIVDEVKDDEEDSVDDTPDGIDPTEETQVNESVFHHYLMKQYKENAVPTDPETMLIKPMVETALHYVTRILFNDGFSRKMGMEVK